MFLFIPNDERESFFKGLAKGRKDGAMDYRLCLRYLKGHLPADRKAPVEDRNGQKGGLRKGWPTQFAKIANLY